MAMWQSKKLAGKHTSFIKVAFRLVKAAENLSEVTRISLGIIIPTKRKTGNKRVKFTLIRGGLLARVRGNVSVQEIRIYTFFPDKVQGLLKDVQL